MVHSASRRATYKYCHWNVQVGTMSVGIILKCWRPTWTFWREKASYSTHRTSRQSARRKCMFVNFSKSKTILDLDEVELVIYFKLLVKLTTSLRYSRSCTRVFKRKFCEFTFQVKGGVVDWAVSAHNWFASMCQETHAIHRQASFFSFFLGGGVANTSELAFQPWTSGRCFAKSCPFQQRVQQGSLLG